MTRDEAIAYGTDWQKEVDDARAQFASDRDLALSRTRAQAGASGVRKGTESWDTMMYNATRGIDDALLDLDLEQGHIDQYLSNMEDYIDKVISTGSQTPVESTPGDPDSHTEMDPGAGYSEPTTAEGAVAQGVGKSAAKNTMKEVTQTVAPQVTARTAMALGLNPTQVMAVAGITFGTMGTVAGAMANDEFAEQLKEDTLGKLGIDKGLASNLTGIMNIGLALTGLYAPIQGIKGLVGMAQAGTLDDFAWEIYDTVASAIDGGMNPSDARAGRQSNNQANENDEQEAGAGAVGPSSAEQNAGFNGTTDMANMNELGSSSQHNTAQGHQDAADAANETAASGSNTHGLDNDTVEQNTGFGGGFDFGGGFGGFGEDTQAADNPEGTDDSDADTGGGETGGADSENEGSGGETEGSCFVAGTKVLMRDGSSRNIEDVAIGDYVVGQYGEVSQVLAYDRPKLGSRKLYAINGREPFVTAEHPFMTQNGWMSIDPEATKAEGVDVDVKTLLAGEYLIRFNSSIKLKSLDEFNAKSETQLYNFALDGNHTYYANGFLVHNKI